MSDEMKKQVPPGKGSSVGEIGVTGLEEFAGQIDEEKLTQLKGEKAAKTFRQMSDNDATIGAIFFAVDNLLRKVPWPVEPASDAPEDVEAAEFVASCRDDMSHSWQDFISEVLSMLPFGWSSTEIVYKIRLGPDQTDPTKRSKFNDGKIGWRKLPIRAQETLDHWEFDDDGGIKGWWQDPIDSGEVFLPIEKLLLFRTTSRKNNPEGRSLLRNAYVSWYRKKEIERIEAIGIERDLAGLPLLYLPPEMMDTDNAETKTRLDQYKKIVRNIRNDEQAALILPSMFDENGNRLVEISLMGTTSTRMIDTDKVIMRYTRAIAMSVLADIILLGHEKVGSFALASSKTTLFSQALGTFLDEIQSVLNMFAIPRLLRLNNMQTETPPQFKHGDIEKQDVLEFAKALEAIAGVGGIIAGSETDENFFRSLLGMPKAEPGFSSTQQQERQQEEEQSQEEGAEGEE